MSKYHLLNLLSSLALVSMFFFLGYGLVAAADTGTVTATVTVQNVSITVSDGTVAYGTLATSSNKGTHSGDLNQSQTATNNGNVTEDFNIKGQNSTAWTLAGSAGADQYSHKFCTSSCGTPPTNYTALTTDYATLASDVTAAGGQAFDLYISTPTSTSSFDQQSVDVTVQAVAG